MLTFVEMEKNINEKFKQQDNVTQFEKYAGIDYTGIVITYTRRGRVRKYRIDVFYDLFVKRSYV